MADPFESSRRKIAWAKKHIEDLTREVNAFLKEDPYEVFTEPHPSKAEHVVYKVRLRPLPSALAEITGDAVNNLRSALDHAMYAVAVASGCDSPKNAYFPFSRTAADFENNLRGRCKDVPKEIYPLLRAFKPYNGGNQLLFALNIVCTGDKHKILIPVVSWAITTGVDLGGTGHFTMPNPPIWDSAKNEMELLTLGPGAKYKASFNFTTLIAFGESKSLGGAPAVTGLNQFVSEVESVLLAIEAESRRLGFIK